MAKTKDAQGTLRELDPIAGTIICTNFFTQRQDFKSASLKPDDLAELARQATNAEVLTASSHSEALELALNAGSDSILITGSFYFLGEINTLLVWK